MTTEDDSRISAMVGMANLVLNPAVNLMKELAKRKSHFQKRAIRLKF